MPARMAGGGALPNASLLIGRSVSPTETLAIARRAEDAGVRHVWVTEDYFYKAGFSSVAAILAATETLSVGLGVVSAFVRSPAVAAMEIATISNMFPGRFVPGVGVGVGPMLDALDLHPSRVVGSLDRAIRAMRTLVHGGSETVEDEMFALRDVAFERPSAVEVPIFMAAMGPQMLRLAGRSADGLILSALSSPGYVRWALDQTVEDADLDVTMFGYVVCSADGAAARTAARRFLADRFASHGHFPTSLLQRADSWPLLEPLMGRTAAEMAPLLPDEVVDDFLVSGDPDRCLEVIAGFRAAGVTQPALCPIPDTDDRYDFDPVIDLVLRAA